MATTAFALLVRFRSSFLEWVSFRAHRNVRFTGSRAILERPALRWHYRVLCLGTLKQEFCNLYHRMEILRSGHPCRPGITPLSPSELTELARPFEGKLLHARIRGIRRLQTILRTATLVDLHVVVVSIHRRPK
jgi:hypothetical protein